MMQTSRTKRTLSVICTETCDSRASKQALGNDAEKSVGSAAAARLMDLQPSAVDRTGLTAERLEVWRHAASIITV
jgi:hypothetical protein